MELPPALESNFREIGRHIRNEYQEDTEEPPKLLAAIMLAEDYIGIHSDDFDHKGDGQYVYSGGGNAAIPQENDDDGDDEKIAFSMGDDPEEIDLHD